MKKLLIMATALIFISSVYSKTTVVNETPYVISLKTNNVGGKDSTYNNVLPGQRVSSGNSLCRREYILSADQGFGMQEVLRKQTNDCGGREIHVKLVVDTNGNVSFAIDAGLKA